MYTKERLLELIYDLKGSHDKISMVAFVTGFIQGNLELINNKQSTETEGELLDAYLCAIYNILGVEN